MYVYIHTYIHIHKDGSDLPLVCAQDARVAERAARAVIAFRSLRPKVALRPGRPGLAGRAGLAGLPRRSLEPCTRTVRQWCGRSAIIVLQRRRADACAATL